MRHVPTRTDVKTSVPQLNLSNINLVETDVTWKGENKARFVERWSNEVIK